MFRRTWRKIFYLLCFFIGLFVRWWFSRSVSIALKKKKQNHGMVWVESNLVWISNSSVTSWNNAFNCYKLSKRESRKHQHYMVVILFFIDFQIRRWLRQRLLSLSALLALGNVQLVHCCYIILSSTSKGAPLCDQCAILFPVVSHHIVKVR